MEISQIYNGKHDALAAANDVNNQLNVWGNTGANDNNTRINGNALRVALEFNCKKIWPDSFSHTPGFWYDIYVQTRRNKRSKNSALKFEIDQFTGLYELAVSVETQEYVPKTSTMFMVTKPCRREIIAANFSDRIAQTYLVHQLNDLFEQHMSPHSFSCRVGKGSLRAAYHLQDVMRSATHGWKTDAWLYKTDFRSFFMSIDMNTWEPKLEAFIEEYYHGRDKDELLYLCRIIYLSVPQMHCDIKSPPILWQDFPKHKSMRHKDDGVGVPIGNVTSQAIANFVTTLFIRIMDAVTYGSSHYTDDNAGVTVDKETFLQQLPFIRDYVWEEMRLNLHKDKFYFQHVSKGITFLGYKIKGERMLPSERSVHNLRWNVALAIRNTENDFNWIIRHKEHVLDVVNSYLGLMKWCASYKIRKDVCDKIAGSKLSAVFVCSKNADKISMKDEYKIERFFGDKAKTRKKEIINYNTLTFKYQ